MVLRWRKASSISMAAASPARTGYCLGCLRRRKLTDEHIFPQALGSRVSAYFLCKSCNDLAGSEIDSDVVAAHGPIASLMATYRARGDHQPVKVQQVATGDELLLSPKGATRAKPRVNLKFDADGRVRPDVAARSEAELRAIIKGIERKYGPIGAPVITEATPEVVGEGDSIFTMGGDRYFRGIAKIAYLSLALLVGERKVRGRAFDAVRAFVFTGQGDRLAFFDFVHTEFLMQDGYPFHRVTIHFDSKSRNVIGYVMLFGIFRFSVLLARSCPWKIALPEATLMIDPKTGRRVTARKQGIWSWDVPDDAVLQPPQTRENVLRAIESGMRSLTDHMHPDLKAKFKSFSEVSDDATSSGK